MSKADSSEPMLTTEDNQKPQGHWLMDNWIFLALVATAMFTMSNLFISDLSSLGAAGC